MVPYVFILPTIILFLLFFQLHGSFVWDRVIKNPEGNHVISTPWSQRDIARSGAVVISNQPKPANVAAAIQPETIPPIDGLPPL